MKAVFETRADTEYDDDIAERYHFPNRYVPEAQRAVGDWIVYRQPRHKRGLGSYIAVARLRSIRQDLDRPGYSYADLTDYLPFPRALPFRHDTGYYETELDRLVRHTVGTAMRGRSIRALPNDDFASIVQAAFLHTSPKIMERLGVLPDSSVWLEASLHEQERRIVQVLLNRKLREATFRSAVLKAYGNRCAFSGLHLMDTSGNVEAQAAHILSVARGGPDIVRNGVALSATVHWLFDRFLVSLTDDYELLIQDRGMPEAIKSFLRPHGSQIVLPDDPSLRPNLRYVAEHRKIFEASCR